MNKVQKPVYFVSKALAGSEINYAPIENFIYALVLTSRRLCRYFQGHPIHVLTDLLVKNVLSTPAISGRLAKWAIELGAFEISYLPRTSVKGQVLADYLAEMTGELEVIHERTQLKPLQHEIWDLYTDGASCIEALLAGLNMAHKMNISQLRAYVDSQLVANQFNGSFEAHELSMQKYLKLVQESAEKFEFFELSQVSRSQNKKADALSKLAALTFSHFQKQVWVEELPNKSIDGSLFVAAIEEVEPNWIDPIVNYLRNSALPEDKKEARLAATIIEEVHSGTCALHSGYKTFAAKIMRMDYFWPTLYREVAQIVKRCKSCQRYALQNRKPRHDMIPIDSPWPFYKWAIDIVGPFPPGAGNVKFLIVAIDYFTKWVEAKALRMITGVQVWNFVWEYIAIRVITTVTFRHSVKSAYFNGSIFTVYESQ
ncbi:uncharacterized protein [Rutidosis leptorrhynchoides]|uniref:uncharacterized protein n=1 Tax=Rutidosis leptorrhynchoides TaxID=125765 RepID=UPI003A9A647A